MGALHLSFRYARAQWPGRRGKRHSGFARRMKWSAKGARKNGVLVPLPPWAKEPAAGAAEPHFCVLSSDGKNQRSPGFVSEERQRSSRQPQTPLRGTLPGKLFLEPGAGGTVDCLRFCAAAAGWDISRKPGGLDEENAPVATSRRGWSVIGGRMVSAPTQGGPDNWKKNARLVQAAVAAHLFSA